MLWFFKYLKTLLLFYKESFDPQLQMMILIPQKISFFFKTRNIFRVFYNNDYLCWLLLVLFEPQVKKLKLDNREALETNAIFFITLRFVKIWM